MTAFQAIIYGIVEGFSRCLPIDPNTHRSLVSTLLNWPVPEQTYIGALTLATAAAGFVTFRHDWASIISSFLRVVLLRKRPMTLDERMPLFLILATGPWIFVSKLQLNPLEPVSLMVNLFLFASVGIALILAKHTGRNSKSLFDWNWLDALILGLAMLALWVPGMDILSIGLMIGSMRNYHRDAAVKFIFLVWFPITLLEAHTQLADFSFSNHEAAPGLNWLAFSVGTIAAFFFGMIAIGGLTKNIQKNGITGYAVYRMVLATASAIALWFWR